MSTISKPFLNYKAQIRRLNDKGISCNLPEEKRILIRKGYFNLINGYKKPFVINKNSYLFPTLTQAAGLLIEKSNPIK